jgi:alpha-beta hydrolase superfamily lysophospholipase
MDLREHGYTELDLGYFRNLDDVVDDVVSFVNLTDKFINEKYNKVLPNFIIGSSMGGLIIHYVSKILNFRGVIYNAPCFYLTINSCLSCIVSFVSCCNPKQIVPDDSEPVLCKNPEVDESNDPICKERPVRFGSVKALISKCNQFKQSNNESHEKSFLIIIPGVEKIVCFDTMIEYFNTSKVTDKIAWLYPNLWHGVFLEEEIVDIIPRMVSWIKERQDN